MLATCSTKNVRYTEEAAPTAGVYCDPQRHPQSSDVSRKDAPYKTEAIPIPGLADLTTTSKTYDTLETYETFENPDNFET